MKKFLSFAKKKKHASGTPDNGSALSVGYELKDKDLGKVHKAASVGDLAKLKQLAKKNDINQLDKENRTALHIACANGHVDVVQFLLESKAKLNLCDNQNRSALMKAVQCQHEPCVSMLLENHADPNLVDINGNTALHLAANIPSISTAASLLEHEADINAQNKEAFTPLTVAVREDHIEMAEFLLKEGADVNFRDQDQSCSLLIIEHSNQRNDGQRLSHQDFEDNSQSESLSRVSKSAADEWPSSEDDDESVLIKKKPQKVNLRKMIASKRGEASALHDRSLSGTESEPESENRVQRIPSTTAPQHPVDPSPVSFLSKAPQMTSTPLPSHRKTNLATEKQTGEQQCSDGSSEDEDKENNVKESNEPPPAVSPVPEEEKSTRNQILDMDDVESIGQSSQMEDFLSELGLEKGEEEPDSWDSESHSENPNMSHQEKQSLHTQDQLEMPIAKEEIKENLFYIPSFLRGEGDNRMAVLEPRRSVGWPRGSQGEEHEAESGPVQKPHLEPIREDNTAILEPERINASLKEDPEEFNLSHPPSLRCLASVPGVSDEELEEDMERFKAEVGKDTTMTAVQVQKSSTSWDSGGTALEEVGTEKPETRLGRVSSRTGAMHQEQQPEATKSTNGAPVQFPETNSSNRQEGHAVEEILQPELVRGARRSRAPQTNAHVNGDPLSVFDDSTFSEVSDDEGRYICSMPLIQNPEEVDMAEDFDELTQSSDTATDDIDSPTSGYRHASLLVQKLDSTTLDSRSMVKLQNIFHEYERSIQKSRSRHGYLSDKVSQLEMEKAELKSSLEEVKDIKSGLERNQLELQTEVTNLKFQLKQEQENRRNATMMYNTIKDKLRRTEEQQQLEVQERQKVELTLRNLELEMRTLVNNMKQLEEDHSETQRLLAQERSARTLQENLLNSHLRKQQEIEDENKRNISKSNEALSQLTEASDRERELLQQTANLQEQLTILRMDLERSQANSNLKESHLSEENEALKEQLEDARRDLKLNGDALTQTVYNCNNQMSALKSELAIASNRLENERQARETLETEVESTRTRLAGAVKETELCLAAHTETERALLREKEEHQRLKDKFTGETASQREAVNSLSQKLSKAEARANSMENEVHQVTLQLTEKGLLLEVLQREKEQAGVRVKELETTLNAERDVVSRTGARHEAMQERLAQAQSEGMLLRQQLEEAQNKGVAKERAVTDAQERFSDILTKLRSDCEERVQLVEERNKELASKAADLRDQIYKLEEEKNERETSLRQLQQELADSLKKLSMSEASLEVNTRYRNDLEEEKARLLKDMDRLKGKLEESEDQYVQAERRINSLKSTLDEREKELTTAAQKLQEALSASAASDITIKQLEEAVQRLEIENARLEAAAKQQANKIDALQKEAQEAAMMEIEKKKAKKIGEQKKAVDTRLDQEMKRNTELQKEMYRLRTLLKTAKKKLRDQDAGGAEFASPMSSLRMDVGRHIQADGAFGRMKDKVGVIHYCDFGAVLQTFPSNISPIFLTSQVDDLQEQLEKEVSRRSQLEKVNGDLKDQLASLKSSNRSNDQLERSKRQLEEEVLDLRRRMEASQMEQSQVEQFRRDAEDRARQEIQQKLEQVNIFLQSQAASQEALDQIKAANEANLRAQLRETERELGRARSTQQDSVNQRDSTRTELERYRQLYAEELRLRKSLAAKLERANSRLSEANSKLLNERSRSLITSSIANGSLGGPSLDVGSLGSPVHYGATLGPLNRSLGLGLSLLSPVTDGQNSRVEDYLAKMQSELDRKISKELNNATAELDLASARMSPVGSASRVELDAVSKATQQYLEVLKKNYEI
ncbi:Ankyrin repeat domain-containing protein 26 [Collichthys lucidus]|uniref:Ankyrin repeat domain-containing protein 26 n=1 Tax=Collichthys lucidus TaxID=240159 RepID=A0A4U5U288_COLLU|nr:Ankyrin repeat domain-containing protein 26 [Collichthys lucidus]